MKTIGISVLCISLLLCAAPGFGQQAPEPFFYNKSGFVVEGIERWVVHQVGPRFDLLAKAAVSDGEFTAIALSAGTSEGYYYLGLCHARRKGSRKVLKDLMNRPLSLSIDGDTIIVNNDRYHRDRVQDGVLLEILMFGISKDLFNELTSARQVYAEVGKFDYLASAENLRAFRFLSEMLKRNDGPNPIPITVPGEQQPLKGFYFWDGYYIKGFNRREHKP